ncbi:hypothetical protein [Micromonospora endophytica (Xie et al. 2001) Li et al. 2019]
MSGAAPVPIRNSATRLPSATARVPTAPRLSGVRSESLDSGREAAPASQS